MWRPSPPSWANNPLAGSVSPLTGQPVSLVARQRWQWEVNRFKSDTKRAEGIDYDNDKKLSADLDLMVKSFAQRGVTVE